MRDVQEYPLGYSSHEEQRLSDQGAQLKEFTEDVLRRAGIRRDMHVLDIGSGVGDLSLLLARLVGPSGSVTGVEKAAASIETATRRAWDAGIRNVSFEEADLADFDTSRTFDAIVGRFVLSYVPDRSALLARLIRRLRPGGIVASMEIDMSQISQEPPSDLFMQVRGWILDAFAASGAELDMGGKIHATFAGAGLPHPEMVAAHPVVGGPASSGYGELIQALRSLLPLIRKNNIADVEEADLEGLLQRMREDAAAMDRVIYMSRVVGAWSQIAYE